MVKDIFAKKENREQEKKYKRRGLSIAEQKYFDKKWAEEQKRHRLDVQKKTRDKKRDAESEKFLRTMCATKGISTWVQKKYTTMVKNMQKILTNLEDDETLGIMKHALEGKEILSPEYKNKVNHYADEIKKIFPKGANRNDSFEKFIKDMEEDDMKIKKFRDELYKAKDIDEILTSTNEGITEKQINAVKKLIGNKFETKAHQNLKSIGIHLKKAAKEELRASRLLEKETMSETSDRYLSSNGTTPRSSTEDTLRKDPYQ